MNAEVSTYFPSQYCLEILDFQFALSRAIQCTVNQYHTSLPTELIFEVLVYKQDPNLVLTMIAVASFTDMV